MGGRAASGSGPGAHTRPQRGQGMARAMGWCDCPLASVSALDSVTLRAFVSSNSENIFCVAFLKHKNSRKQGTGTVASR
jgi:hypothetical protein